MSAKRSFGFLPGLVAAALEDAAIVELVVAATEESLAANAIN